MSKAKGSKNVPVKAAPKDNKPKTDNQKITDIVAGKFNENDWNNMIDTDQAQEFVWEIIDEVLNNADKIIFDGYIKRQLIPFTVQEAKTAILHIIDWTFLATDSIESDSLLNIDTDEEPQPSIIDNWAQGYIQTFVDEKTHTSKTDRISFLEELMDNNQKQIIKDPVNESYVDEILCEDELEINKAKLSSEKTNLSKLNKEKSKTKLVESKPKKIVAQQPLPSEIKLDLPHESTLVKRISQNIEKSKRLDEAISKAPAACHSILKSLLGRPSGFRELELDSNGNVVSIMRIDPDDLPSMNIRPKFSISDAKQKDLKSKFKNKKTQQVKEDLAEKFRRNNETDDMDNLLEPAQGVIFKMGKVTRVGPKRNIVNNKTQSLLNKTEKNLKPIRGLSEEEKHEILDRYSIDLYESTQLNSNSLPKFKPIPPISANTSEVN